MNWMTRVLIGLLALAPVANCSQGAEKHAAGSRSPIVVSKDTTFVTGPLTKSGYVDFAAALNKKFSAGVTTENNAAVLFVQASGPEPEGLELSAEFFKLLGIDAPPDNGKYFKLFDGFAAAQRPQRGGRGAADANVLAKAAQDSLNRAMKGPWKEEDLPLIARWLEANEQPLRLVVAGTQRSRYYLPIIVPEAGDDANMGGLISVLLPHVQLTRSFARALVSRAMLRLGKGQVDAAWQDLMACHRLGRLAGGGATLIDALVGIAIDSIAVQGDLAFLYHTRPNPQQVDRYLRDLQGLAPLPDMAEKIQYAERFMFLDCVQQLAQGKSLSELDVGGNEVIDRIVRSMAAVSIDWNETMRVGNHWYDRLTESLRQGNREQMKAKLNQYENELQGMIKATKKPLSIFGNLMFGGRAGMGRTIGRVLVALVLPAVSAAQSAKDRGVQQIRNLRVAAALAGYRSDRGRYPESLEDLSPRYLAQIPDDLFAGGPLQYRPNERGYLLYSVGANGKDEAGHWYDDEPRGDDLRVRVPPENDD